MHRALLFRALAPIFNVLAHAIGDSARGVLGSATAVAWGSTVTDSLGEEEQMSANPEMAMDVSQLCRTLRLVLESAPDAPSVEDLLKQVDSFVQGVQSSPGRTAIVVSFEDELQTIHDTVIDYASLTQPEPFLGVLYHLRPILPPSSIISTWFEPTLRPALREPRLPAPSVEYAKGLVIAALGVGSYVDGSDEEREKQKEKMSGFRRRLMDLYLLDAYNESSGDDVLEWATLDVEQREKKSCWKANLEDVLIRVGLERPEVSSAVAMTVLCCISLWRAIYGGIDAGSASARVSNDVYSLQRMHGHNPGAVSLHCTHQYFTELPHRGFPLLHLTDISPTTAHPSQHLHVSTNVP